MSKVAESNNPNWARGLPDPLAVGAAATDYWRDALQRTLLYADIRRQRGDQYRAHLQESSPNVLNFPSEIVMSGLDLPRPVNYGMVRIIPAEDQPINEFKRPFVVIDPRAGHGPGIGGFKPDSEIGAAMKAGHPCYFVGFLPDPVPGQTVEDVMRAIAEFVRRAAQPHPACRGKPAVIGNCQAGWLVMMAASLWPDLFGPIIVAGTPLSYWAGDNPMRYAGGLTGGSWLTAMTSDLGAGRFDGAWLVNNFEKLDPANTFWKKQYNVYANVDTEGPRYLAFEKYWGGYVFLNDVEMQYIVDKLFIGNKLATAELITSDGLRIDLRNIRSPIVVFCSYGDNITPPAQALGWITDMYLDDTDVISHDQTIVYATHESIGHLGIFVSSSVGRKEHLEFATNIDLIDLIPPGIYQATIEDQSDSASPDDEYRMSIQARSVEDVRAIVQPDPASERRFEAASRLSEINLALYQSFVQPWVRAVSTPVTAQWLQALHPLRTGYENWSSHHPLAPVVSAAAKNIRKNRHPVNEDNPFLKWQELMSNAIGQSLNMYRDQRDQTYASVFTMIYGSPWIQALTGQTANDTSPVRKHPGESPEHRAFVIQKTHELHQNCTHGGLIEAGVRAVLYILRLRGEADGHRFHLASHLRSSNLAKDLDIVALRTCVRLQALLLANDCKAAIAAIPSQLAQSSATEIRALAAMIVDLVHGSGSLSDAEENALQEMLAIFDAAALQRELVALPVEAVAPPPA